MNVNDSFRCNRSAHLRDRGPDPHWAALVELLLASTATRSVLGVGFPYFKVCNTFTQIAAALADAPPPWLCPLAGRGRGRARVASSSVRLLLLRPTGARARADVPKGCGPLASRRRRQRRDPDCGRGHCMPTPLHPSSADPPPTARSAPAATRSPSRRRSSASRSGRCTATTTTRPRLHPAAPAAPPPAARRPPLRPSPTLPPLSLPQCGCAGSSRFLCTPAVPASDAPRRMRPARWRSADAAL